MQVALTMPSIKLEKTLTTELLCRLGEFVRVGTSKLRRQDRVFLYSG